MHAQTFEFMHARLHRRAQADTDTGTESAHAHARTLAQTVSRTDCLAHRLSRSLGSKAPRLAHTPRMCGASIEEVGGRKARAFQNTRARAHKHTHTHTRTHTRTRTHTLKF